MKNVYLVAKNNLVFNCAHFREERQIFRTDIENKFKYIVYIYRK